MYTQSVEIWKASKVHIESMNCEFFLEKSNVMRPGDLDHKKNLVTDFYSEKHRQDIQVHRR